MFARQEHVKKHGEVVQFLCQFCSASLSTQSQYRKHLKMRHNKTIDIMGNVIDSPPDYKEREKVKRKRRMAREEAELSAEISPNMKKRRRRKLKSEAPEISQYEEVVQSSSSNGETGTVLYEETISLSESAQMYQNSEFYEPQNGYEIIETSTQNGSVLAVIQPNQQQTVASTVVKTEPAAIKPQTSQVAGVSGARASGYIAISQPQVSSQTPQSPVIFVVPNSGQKKSSDKELQAARKPLIVNDQKKPIVVSKFQSNTNQGVIAQINGQKVLLVPKKSENVKTTIQKIQPLAVKLASAGSTSGASLATANLTKTEESSKTEEKVVAVLQDPLPPENQENDLENNKMSNILEQAMHEVFPASLEEEKIETEMVEVETSKDNAAAGGDLYNPMRSPLKNRNKILCEVLGIDS